MKILEWESYEILFNINSNPDFGFHLKEEVGRNLQTQTPSNRSVLKV